MSLIDDLITKCVKRQEIVLREPIITKSGKKIVFKPFITISRESGGGGKLIAKKVAKKLGYKLYDKKLIDLVAKEVKRRKNLIESLDEKDRGLVEDLVLSMFSPDYVAKETFFKHLCHVVITAARKGNCVILGRGANFITNYFGGFHVRVVAPYLIRSGYTAKYEKYSIYEARERVKRFDKERKEYIKTHFDKDPSNANYYDLVVNTSYLNLDQAANIIVAAFKQKFPDWRKYL